MHVSCKSTTVLVFFSHHDLHNGLVLCVGCDGAEILVSERGVPLLGSLLPPNELLPCLTQRSQKLSLSVWCVAGPDL